MLMPKKRVRIHYRRYYRTSEPAVDCPLSQATAQALAKQVDGQTVTDEVSLRTFDEGDHGILILNGRLPTRSNDVFGELVRYNPDANIPLLMRNSESSAELEIREAPKPNGAELIKGMSFFLLTGDHVFVIEEEMPTTGLERYLRWLICDRSAVANRNTRIQLIPEVLLGTDADVMREVRSFSLRPEPAMADSSSLLSHRMSTQGPLSDQTDVWSVLKAAHVDTTVLERLTKENETSVQIRLEVSFRSGRRRVSIEGDDAVSLLRHIPEDELVVEGNGARRNRGRLERLSVAADVKKIGDIIDRQDAWAALNSAADQYRERGFI